MAWTLMLDTNVVLDKLLRRDEFYEDSNRLFIMYALGDAANYISANMLADVFYIAKREQGQDSAYQILGQGLSTLNICNVTAEDCVHCFNQRWDDFEDSLVARCAENINADYIITRNKCDFAQSTIPVVTPKELFELLETRDSLSYAEVDLRKYLS